MPELPEVETIRRGLVPLVVGETMDHIHVSWPRIIQTTLAMEAWQTSLVGRTIHGVDRRGKYLLFDLGPQVLISHLRMEGKYFYFLPSALPTQPSKHTHVIFYFQSGTQLHYQDVRKFGRMQVVAKAGIESFFAGRKLGPEPFSPAFNPETFYQALQHSQRMIKPLLLDQKVVAGLGNIYVDEGLFLAGIHPCRPANHINQSESRRLYQAILQVLEEAIKAGGTTIRTYTDNLGQAGKFQVALNVYGRKGEPCPRCGQPIEKVQLMQRGTHFCRTCQL